MTLILGQIALRRGQELEINWYGRIAVFPIMGAIFWAMVFESWVWNVMLIVGVALGRDGDDRLRPLGPPGDAGRRPTLDQSLREALPGYDRSLDNGFTN